MTILSPGGSQEFEWTDVKGLPQPASGNGSTGAASAATLPLAPVPGISPEPAIDETLNGNDGNADTANSNG
jgi:hypothetical protein